MDKKSIIVKYLLLLGLIYDLISSGFMKNESSIIFILLYITIVQIRMYNSKPCSDSMVSKITLPLDLLFMVYLYRLNSVSVFIYLIVIFDSFIYLKDLFYIPVLLASGIYAINTVTRTSYNYNEFLIIIVFLVIVWLYRDDSIMSRELNEDNYKLISKIDRLKEEIKIMEGSMNTARELYTTKERNRISRELHDSIGHSLSTIVINLRAIEKMSAIDPKKTSEMTNSLMEFSKEALQNLRTTLTELKPSDITSKNIQISIEQLITNFADLTSISVNFRVSQNVWDMSEENELLIYRAVQEFLSNSAKHGNPKSINIFMNYGHEQLILSLKDDGIGTDKIVENVGLTGLRERVIESGGNIEYSSSSGNGFFMRIVIPRFYKEIYNG